MHSPREALFLMSEVPLYKNAEDDGLDCGVAHHPAGSLRLPPRLPQPPVHREFFIDNLLVRIHFIIDR